MLLTALLHLHLTLCAGDAVTTALALRSGAHETVLTQNAAVDATLIAATCGATTAVTMHARRSHPRAAVAVTVALVVVRALVVKQNLTVIRTMHDGRPQ